MKALGQRIPGRAGTAMQFGARGHRGNGYQVAMIVKHPKRRQVIGGETARRGWLIVKGSFRGPAASAGQKHGEHHPTLFLHLVPAFRYECARAQKFQHGRTQRLISGVDRVGLGRVIVAANDAQSRFAAEVGDQPRKQFAGLNLHLQQVQFGIGDQQRRGRGASISAMVDMLR